MSFSGFTESRGPFKEGSWRLYVRKVFGFPEIRGLLGGHYESLQGLWYVRVHVRVLPC